MTLLWAAMRRASRPSASFMRRLMRLMTSTFPVAKALRAASSGPQRLPRSSISLMTMGDRSMGRVMEAGARVVFRTILPRGRTIFMASSRPSGRPVQSTTMS